MDQFSQPTDSLILFSFPSSSSSFFSSKKRKRRDRRENEQKKVAEAREKQINH